MRTTLTVDDDLILFAKRQAAETGQSLSDVVNRALRRAMATEPEARTTAPTTITFGAPGTPFPDEDDFGRAEARLDDEYLIGKLGRP